MAVIAVSPLFMREATLSVAADDYATAVSSITLTPSASVVSFKGLKPTATFTDVTAPTWTLDITAAQDDADDSLFMYLWDNQGETVEMVFTPRAGGRTWTVDAVITPGAIGGAVDTYGTFSVQLGVSGQPVPGALA